MTSAHIRNVRAPADLGHELMKARRAKGWSQKQVCQALGLGDKTLSRYEQGACHPRIECLAMVCDLLEVKIEDVVYSTTAYVVTVAGESA